MKDLNCAALVTGGASGLGLATALALANGGSRVTVVDRQAGPAHEGVVYETADVTSEEQVQTVLDRMQQRGGAPRIVVNCAGVGYNARLLGRAGVHTLELFSRVVQVNLIGTFNVLRLAAQRMAELPALADGERGVFVNTASIAAFDGQIGQAAYSASKAGVVGMTLPLARELGRSGIRCVTVCPGVFRTPMVDQHVTDEVLDGLLQNAAWPQRGGDPAEFADFVLAIVRNSMVNGEAIRLDGALRMPAR